jgi:hypothetical protein
VAPSVLIFTNTRGGEEAGGTSGDTRKTYPAPVEERRLAEPQEILRKRICEGEEHRDSSSTAHKGGSIGPNDFASTRGGERRLPEAKEMHGKRVCDGRSTGDEMCEIGEEENVRRCFLPLFIN